MRINGYEIEAKTFENLSIELDDEYSYMDFYKIKNQIIITLKENMNLIIVKVVII